MTPSESYLRQIIAEAGGSITAERFMQEALYHPTFGYYSSRVRQIGRDGDFSTSVTLHAGLSRAIAAWAQARAREVRAHGQWHIVELGGGSGELAATVLGALGWLRRRGLTYHLLEVSSGLRAAQQQRLGRFAGIVRWHDAMAPALQAADGSALIFSNEFVDAFPCVQLQRAPGGGAWREVHVAWPAGSPGPTECLRDWPRAADAVAPFASASTLPAAPRLEAQFSYQRWLASWRPLWRQGRLLTIDYGAETAELHARRPAGTFRAYCRQLRFTGLEVYARFGQQDLTADVNFTDLQKWGAALGLQNIGLATQRDFLQRWLPRRLLARSRDDPALEFILQAPGAGDAFKVLEQAPLAAPAAARLPQKDA